MCAWVLMHINNCDHNYARSHLRYPRVILASKLSLIIFIGSCGPVELLLKLLLKSVRVHFAPGKIAITS